MICIKCGEQLFEDSKFCPVCGTPVQAGSAETVYVQPVISPVQPVIMSDAEPQASAQLTPQKTAGKKPILIIVIAAAALVVLAVGAIFVYNTFFKSDSAGSSDKPSYLLVVKGEDEVLVYAGAKKPIKVDGLMKSSAYTMDGKKLALSVDADDEGLADLWYCDGKTAVDVASGVYNFYFSASGSKIAYLTDYDYESGTGALYLYDVQTKKSKEIADEAAAGFVMSPDGKSIAYTSDVKMDDYGYVESYTGYLSINGAKAEALEENQCVFAMANDGKYIYYVETDSASPDTGDLFLRQGKTDDKIGSADLYNAIYLNKDCSELLFVKSGATYLCADGKEKEKISGMTLSTMVVSEGVQYYSNNSNTVYAAILGISSFTEQLYAFSDEDNAGTTLSYLKKDLSSEDIDDLNDYYYMYNVTLQQNGKDLYYLNDSGKILHYKDYRDLDTDPAKIEADEDIIYFIVMPDQSAVYFIDAEQTLWVQRGKEDPEEIASDVNTYSLSVTKDEKGIYYICDFEAADDAYDAYAGGGTLNYIKNAAKAKSVEIAEDVYSVAVYDYGTVYYVYDSTDESTGSYIGEVFISQNDKDFTSITDTAIFG